MLAMPPPMPLKLVEWRADSDPQTRNGKQSCRWVPHLTAAGCARLLDEWAGPTAWRVKYAPWEFAGALGLMCQIDVYDSDIGEWVTKVDAGDPMKSPHQIKGSISDAFKRCAGRAWGCGRNVYEIPTLYAPCGSYQAKSGKLVATLVGETKPALVEQLRRLGYDDAGDIFVAEADDWDEPAPTHPRQEAPQAPPKPKPAPEQAEVPAASPDAHSDAVAVSPDAIGKSLQQMMGEIQSSAKVVMTDLRSAGLWPVSTVAPNTPDWATAATIIQRHIVAEKAAAR
jgi:hypothetical protein